MIRFCLVGLGLGGASMPNERIERGPWVQPPPRPGDVARFAPEGLQVPAMLTSKNPTVRHGFISIGETRAWEFFIAETTPAGAFEP